VQANHPDVLAELDREQARLNRINRSAEPGVFQAQRYTLEQVKSKIREVLATRSAAAAD
jgi:hypothetical protein